MLALSSKFVPHPSVVHTKLDNGDIVLLHLGTGQYYSLNQSGAWIWERIILGSTLSEIIQQLEAAYDVTAANAQASATALATELVHETLVEVINVEVLHNG
jgi:hypothetical protein